ncbi:MAG: flagellar motor protein MotB [Balneola sp.]|jgi:outer membrane protein OmpA-like peptidoglycan-associated protein|nr:flagellar motor protein MotB [Balneola sp.]MBE77710.1 flagellar motor protein MotB [Balneola sp.]HBX66735.1 flagellar motor protein MotB [Balneolaceae bacterium]|tara:strand:- start:300 stop:1187 length:888 start_codon:yes stop_codon:yes gene_type:complete
MKFFSLKIPLLSIVVTALLIGCGGPPQNNPLLMEAENSYNQAENDSLVVLKAPVALKEAEEALEQSQQIWKEEGEDKATLVEHYAYIAQQKTKVARETAKLNAAQDEVEQAEAERKQVLIEARKAEAIAAERRAENALEQVKKERAEAEKARQEASELASRLSEMEARQSERGMVLTLGDVLFDFNSSNLKAGANKVVNELANFLKEYPQRSIQIEGFTDSVGSAEYNKNLSQRRADALQDALVNAGISSRRIETIGYGEEYPVATNMNEAGRQQNRRVEVIISNENGVVTQRTQ